MNKIKVIGLFLLLAGMMQAQGIIDEVIWVVGDEAILRSEVEEERLRAQYEGQPINGDPYCVIPEQLAVQKLFLHQAILDSVEANESSVSHSIITSTRLAPKRRWRSISVRPVRRSARR